MGNVFYYYGSKSFNSEDMEYILRGIREKAGSQRNLALLWDNASYHKAKTLQEFAKRPDIDIRLIFNLPARPNLGTWAIETLWSMAKRFYRREVDHYRV